MEHGKSDFVIVPMNQVIIGEGRAKQKGEVQVGTKEPNSESGNPNGRRAITGNDLESKRARIAAKARSNPKEQFNNLIHHLSPDLIQECLCKIPWNSAPGGDGMTVEQALKGSSWLLPPLIKAIHQGNYQAPPVRRVYIPKANGGQRPLGIPEIIDRAIQAATASVLNEIYEQDFLNCSFGFRPKRSCHHALATLNDWVQRGKLSYVLEVDIRDFFGSINHEWMMKFLQLRISDLRLLKLIESWLKAGVMEDRRWQAMEAGTPQGGSVSPVLANVYLHYVLDLWFEKKVKKQLRGRAQLVRYADDFVILCSDPSDRNHIQALLKARLSQFGLTVAEDKTHQTDLRLRENRGKDRRHMNFLGFTIYRKKMVRGTGVTTVFQTEAKRFTRAKARMKEKLHKMMHWGVEQQVEAINRMLVGHYNYYGMAGNKRLLTNFWYFTLKQWRRRLSRRSQRGRMNWVKLNEILSKHRLAPPRIRVPYSALKSYVCL
jgi:group II intron reverse transcriptase/maturase